MRATMSPRALEASRDSLHVSATFSVRVDLPTHCDPFPKGNSSLPDAPRIPRTYDLLIDFVDVAVRLGGVQMLA